MPNSELSKMAEYWLISAPGEKTRQCTWDRLNYVTSQQSSLSVNYKFHVPHLKVGTLDQLVGLSDNLGKLDTYVEGVTRKLAADIHEISKDQAETLSENLQVNGVNLATYLTRFMWDVAKYPVRQSLSNIAEIIDKRVAQIEADSIAKTTAYNTLKSNLLNLERKSTGNLLMRSLGDLVQKEHFVLGSKYLITLLVVVSKHDARGWEDCYETLTDMVVPRSSEKVSEDPDYCLYTVTLFQNAVVDFKALAKKKEFLVRDFKYNAEELEVEKCEQDKLKCQKIKQFSVLFQWLKINFGETFAAWIHVKALRVFVDSVLRYGLPVNFQAMLLQPQKSPKKLREALNKLYSHLDTSIAQGPIDDIPGFNLGQQEYYPYVYFKISIDMNVSSRKR